MKSLLPAALSIGISMQLAYCWTASAFAKQAGQFSDESPVQSDESSAPSTEASKTEISRLVAELGDSRFEVREQASAKLRQIGIPAMESLQRALNSDDREVKDRAASLLEAIREGEFERQLKAFMVEPDPAESHGLPAWEYFSRITGSSRVTKQLFVEFQRSQGSLARLIEKEEDIASAAAAAAEAIQADLYIRHTEPDIGDIIGLLLVAGADVEVNDNVHNVIRSSTFKSTYKIEMRETGRGKAMRKLTGRWFLRAPALMAQDLLYIGLEHDVPEAAEIARRVLMSQPIDPEITREALLAVAKLGKDSDIALVEKYLDDQNVIATFQLSQNSNNANPQNAMQPLQAPPPPGILPPNAVPQPRIPQPGQLAPPLQDPAAPAGPLINYATQVGDLALAVIIHLKGESVNDYFPNVRNHPYLFFDVKSLGFPVDQAELRKTTFERWRSRSAAPPASNT